MNGAEVDIHHSNAPLFLLAGNLLGRLVRNLPDQDCARKDNTQKPGPMTSSTTTVAIADYPATARRIGGNYGVTRKIVRANLASGRQWYFKTSLT
jgi:hypothetical protein